MTCRRFKPFRTLPEPKRWPLLGHTHLFIPKIGTKPVRFYIQCYSVFKPLLIILIRSLFHLPRSVRLATDDRSNGRLGTYLGTGVPIGVRRSYDGHRYRCGRRENNVRQRGQASGQTHIPGVEFAQRKNIRFRRISIRVRINYNTNSDKLL